ncbi:unnamed protein product [Strongylus vulgaris]|uniref:VWFA domain-containing protein n=1 Tax=Strongylus vulgaris TaxID=40348 RepID=A0A3P7INJ0_STRVU|nr:unnamed protein product [Strongylus vulgaris]
MFVLSKLPKRLLSAQTNAEAKKKVLKIGSLRVPIGEATRPELVPARGSGPALRSSAAEVLAHLKWMLQKEILCQDIFLIGVPGSFRTDIVLQYLELCNREYEYLAVTRDTTEADIKQRREIRGGTAYYSDLCAVRAALHGRVLVIDGVEKAERNVLPILNNLLENREMQLEDGRFLMHHVKYDKLKQNYSSAQLREMGIERVSERFHIIALGLPVPRFIGNSLDPPLRSRFQCRSVQDPSFEASYHGNWLTIIFYYKSSFQTTRRLCSELAPSVSSNSITDLISMIYAINSQPDLGISRVPNAAPLYSAEEMFNFMYPCRSMFKEHQMKLVDNFVAKFISEALSGFSLSKEPGFIPTPSYEATLADLTVAHSQGDFALVGKMKNFQGIQSAMHSVSVHTLKDMNSRELFQRRRMLGNGDTLWEDSQLVTAAKKGDRGTISVGSNCFEACKLCRTTEIICRRRNFQTIFAEFSDDVSQLLNKNSVKDGDEAMIPDVLFYDNKEASFLSACVCYYHELYLSSTYVKLFSNKSFPGNDLFGVLGDLFSVHMVDNPSRESELNLLKKYGPGKFSDVENAILLKLMTAFTELREMVSDGILQYPYSTRELVNIVKHINKFPHDSLTTVIRNVFDFDSFSADTMSIEGLPNRVFLSQRLHLEPASCVGTWGLQKTDSPVVLNTKEVYLNVKDEVVVKSKLLKLLKKHMRAKQFTEQECAWQIPMLDVNICSDGVLVEDTLVVATVNPPRLYLVRNLTEANQTNSIGLVDLERKVLQIIKLEYSALDSVAKMFDNGEYRLIRGASPLLFNRYGTRIFLFNPDNNVTLIDLDEEIDDVLSVGSDRFIIKQKDRSKIFGSARRSATEVVDPRQPQYLSDQETSKFSDPQRNALVLRDGVVVRAQPKWRVPKEAVKEALAKVFFLCSRSWLAKFGQTPFVLIPCNSDRMLTIDSSGGVRSFELSPSTLGRSYNEWIRLVGGAEDQDLRLEFESEDKFDISKLLDPKIGKFDPKNAPHHGGNQWMGGTGGYSTAGLGGAGGPFRLDAGHDVHQMPDSAKRQEIAMSEYDADAYMSLWSKIEKHSNLLRSVVEQLEAKEKERLWARHQTTGDLDDGKLIEGITGERNIYKRRIDKLPEPGAPQLKPKRMRLCFDVSGSMYRFNGYDKRLNKSLEAALMVMTSFEGKDDKIIYDITGHSGDGPCTEFVKEGRYPQNNKERLDILKQMLAHTQFCASGDFTIEGLEDAIQNLSNKKDCDEKFVVLISDANLDRYGISPKDLIRAMNKSEDVRSFVILIGSLGEQAARLKEALPVGKAFVCENTSDLPKIMQTIFTSTLA